MEDKPDYGIKKQVKSAKQRQDDFRKNHLDLHIFFKKPDEVKTLEENAKYHSSLGRYVKDCALEGRIKVIELPNKIDVKYIKELHKIGVNLNQITLKLNAGLRDLTEQEALKNSVEATIKLLETIQNSVKI